MLSAYSMSNVYISDDVRFVNNTAISSTGQTISLQNTDVVEISDAHFESNLQINVLVELSTLKIENSTFTLGDANHIKGLDSSVILDNVRIYDSEAVQAGHGFLCERCSFVAV